MSEIVVRKSPINFVDKEVVPYCPGESVEDIRKRLPAEVEFTVSIDGRIIPPEKLSYIYPQPGQVIVFTPYAGDGDILRIVAFIAVAVFAPYVAAGLMNVIGGGTFAAGLAGGISAFGMAGTLMTAGVMIGGGMLVNALMPASVPELPSYDSPRNSQMYSWGAQTTQKQGTAIPYNYGMHKLKGNIINWYTSTYSTADGEKNAINVLICLGIGPYESLSDFRLNGQPLANLPEVTVWTNLGHLDQDPLPGFSDTKIEYPQGIKITQASGGYTYTTIGDDFDKIELELTWPALYFLNDDGRYNSARVEYRIEMSETGAGQWQALTYQPFDKKEGARAGNWSAGYRINATGRTYTFSDGSSCQDRDIWVERYDNNYYQGHRGMTTATEGCRWYGITTRYNGHEVYWHELTSSDVVVSSESSINWEEVQGARDTPRKKTYTFTMPKLGRYDFRLTRITGDSTDARRADEMYFTNIREIRTGTNLEYPRHVLVALYGIASEKLSGSLDFSCVAKGRLVRVWDGSAWTVKYSENPAWVRYDILTQPVYDNDLNVLRYDGMDPSALDLNKFKELADFCDTQIPNDGNEPRIAFNGGFDSITNIWSAIMRISDLDRSVPVHNGLKLTLAIDKARSAAQTFTVGNIERGSFKRNWLGTGERASSLLASFTNREKEYERDEFQWYNPDIDSANELSCDLFGETRPSGVWRNLKYKLNRNQYVLESAELTVFTEALVSTLGDVINVQHDAPLIGLGGRLVAASVSSVTLDKTVTIEAGKTYQVIVVFTYPVVVSESGTNYKCRNSHLSAAANKPGSGADWQTVWEVTTDAADGAWLTDTEYFCAGESVLKTVSNAPGSYTVLDLTTSYSKAPAQYDVYAFGESNKVVKRYVIVDMVPTMEFKCTLKLEEYNESIYGSDFDLPVVPVPDYTSTDVLPPVTDISLDELLLEGQDGAQYDVIDVYFTVPDNSLYAHAEIWIYKDYEWRYEDVSFTGFYRVRDVEINKNYKIAVATVNTLGHRQTPDGAPYSEIYTQGALDPPSTVQNFTAAQDGQFVNFKWDHIPDADLWGYEIRQGVNWEASRVIAEGISRNTFSWHAELNGTYRFLIKSIDQSDLYSTAHTSFDITLKGIDENINVILSQDEITKSGGPDGTKINFVDVPELLALMMPHMLTDTDVPDRTDLDAGLTDYEGDIDTYAEYISNPIDTIKVGDTWTRIMTDIDAYDTGATDQSYPDRTDTDFPQDDDLHVTMPVEQRIYLSYSSNGAAWTAWSEYLGTVQEEFRYAKVKFTINVASETGIVKVEKLLSSFDVPDVDFTIEDFAVSASGNDILFSSYSEQFYNSFTVRPTLLSSTVNKAPVITKDNGLDGFNICLLDKTDAKVAGTVDMHISGY